jgi:hypothetical protein
MKGRDEVLLRGTETPAESRRQPGLAAPQRKLFGRFSGIVLDAGRRIDNPLQVANLPHRRIDNPLQVANLPHRRIYNPPRVAASRRGSWRWFEPRKAGRGSAPLWPPQNRRGGAEKRMDSSTREVKEIARICL